jgi:hypothetical protein
MTQFFLHAMFYYTLTGIAFYTYIVKTAQEEPCTAAKQPEAPVAREA